MGQLLLFGMLMAAPPQFRAHSLSGAMVNGSLAEVTVDSLSIRTADGIVKLETRQLATIDRLDNPADEGGELPIHIQLIDGSRLLGSRFAAARGLATISAAWPRPVELNARALQWVRLRRTPDLDDQWSEQLASETKGDVVIVRKVGRPGAGDERPQAVLDRVEGIIKEVTDDFVHFELDGELVKIKREKLEGLIYYQPPGREVPTASCRVSELGGSVWNAKSLVVDQDALDIVSVAGVACRVALAGIRRFDYSIVNTQFLDELESDSWDWQPFFESRVAPDSLRQFSGRGLPDSARPRSLPLGGRPYEHGLQLRSRSTVVYRIPKEATRFLATVGIDDRLGDAGNVRLIIAGDHRELFSDSVSGGDAPLEVSLDISGLRRLSLLVDFGEELDIGDYLNLCNARFTR